MPRLTSILQRRGDLKKFTNYRDKPALQEYFPIVTRDQVSNRGEKSKAKVCLQEMSHMLVCLKDHEFSQSKCKKEIDAFNACVQEFERTQVRKEEVKAKGLMNAAPGSRVSPRELNKLLKKYPQPK